VSFALLTTALVGMLALVFDLGFFYSQRRFDQNAADAAALAAGHMLAGGVSPLDNSGGLQFGWTDGDVYREVRRYAGLDPSSASTAPTGVNRSAGLVQRTRLAVTLEYSTAGAWCYSPSGPAPPRTPPVPRCALPLQGGLAHPPAPAANQPFKVRVTVSSTTRGLFAKALGTDNQAPAVASGDGSAACIQVAGASGATVCAQAVVAIRGSTTYQGTAPLIPITTGDCQITAPVPGTLFQMWGSNPNGCGADLGSWKNLLDFTTETKWCNTLKGSGASSPDYRYTNLLPPGAQLPGGPCAGERADPSWTRDGYQPDPRWPGNDDVNVDVRYWISVGFGGKLRASYADGNRFPTYVDLKSSPAGDLGQNIASGFYCGSSGVSATGCETQINASGTYFFAKSQDRYHDVCPDPWGWTYGVGCRDATVVTWVQPEWVVSLNTGGTGWTSAGSGGPDRIRAARLLAFRFYCDHTTAGLCTQPPKSIVGSATTASVWGQAVGPLITGPCATCTTGPSLNGNKATLE
jgi:hypothetical protein